MSHLAKTAPFWNEFDGRVISVEVKLIKPDPAIYEYLLEKNGLTNSGCIFIDDSLINVHTAENLGNRAFTFNLPLRWRLN